MEYSANLRNMKYGSVKFVRFTQYNCPVLNTLIFNYFLMQIFNIKNSQVIFILTFHENKAN